ncbi:pyridoxamine 5'-phosphate oxidase family protein [Actinomadura madurae]|uniref:pyridoxamine 5'-phosphate oxidase family protein n=1 Tax=Actinomadura madurae TaxID=1993 RepID=UPI00202625E6|nr:pyridoxamine 5'-phosphate oxidase family protein [Actinomadura madurae]URM99187.1 pyridoxamine 5'-phosphate oxidase family protein [Actinomadura madurae]
MFHPGEVDVQRRAGFRADAHGSARVANTIPEVAGRFLAGQRMIVVSAEHQGSLWTTLLAGQPGFISVPDESTLHIDAALPAVDPLAEAFTTPVEVGMIAIEPEKRRRMRVNGRARPADRGGLLVHTDQVYSNCPKYIQTRSVEAVRRSGPTARTEGSELNATQLAWIRAADTFFVGTDAPGLGVDASHRGGAPGFLDAAPDRVSWPDYTGNSMYMTLGNLALNPRASLLFIDWTAGHTLHLTGTATVDWDEDRAADRPGAQRFVDFHVDHVIQIDHRVGLRWRLDGLSRFNPPPRG